MKAFKQCLEALDCSIGLTLLIQLAHCLPGRQYKDEVMLFFTKKIIKNQSSGKLALLVVFDIA